MLLLTILSARPLTDVQDSDTGQEVRKGGRAGVYIRRRAVMWKGGAGSSANYAAAQLTGSRKLQPFFSTEREGSLSPPVPFYTPFQVLVFFI